jgi:hypothetical protein
MERTSGSRVSLQAGPLPWFCLSPGRLEPVGARIPGFRRETAPAATELADRGRRVVSPAREDLCRVYLPSNSLGDGSCDGGCRFLGGVVESPADAGDGGSVEAGVLGESGDGLDGVVGNVKKNRLEPGVSRRRRYGLGWHRARCLRGRSVSARDLPIFTERRPNGQRVLHGCPGSGFCWPGSGVSLRCNRGCLAVGLC